MKNILIKLILSVVFVSLVMSTISLAVERDKNGNEIINITHPTAAPEVDQGQMSVAITKRNVPRDKTGTSSNIISHGAYDTPNTSINYDLGYTMIRHTPSIAVLEDWEYEIKYDQKTGRIKLLIKLDNDPMTFAKSGFFKINNKTYYFDDDGLMVLGLAKDNMGCEYFFSLETGELVYEK